MVVAGDAMENAAYILKIGDKALARFEIETNFFKNQWVRGIETDNGARGLLPLNMRDNAGEEELERFLRARMLPRNRAHADRILYSFELGYEDIIGFIRVSRAVSFNDSYSVVTEGDDAKFSEYGLFDSAFDTDMQMLALTGVMPDGNEPPTSVAELSVGGSFPKALGREDGRLCLYKAGSALRASNTGREPYSEAIASHTAEMLGIGYADYWLEERHGTLCSVCPIFNTKDISFVPFFLAMPQQRLADMNLRNALEFFENVGAAAAESFKDMLVFDTAIYNPDRHTGNYGVLMDNATGEIIGMAPLFDHNYSFWTLEFPEKGEFSDLARKARGASGAFASLDLGQQALAFGGDSERKDILEKMAEFEMPDIPFIEKYRRAHPDRSDVFSEERAVALQGLVRRNAQELLTAIDRPKGGNRSENLKRVRDMAAKMNESRNEKRERP